MRLYQALCAVANGDIDRGVRQATEVVDGLDSSQRTAMTREDAQVVLRAVPIENRKNASVREFRMVLTSAFGETPNQIGAT